MRVSAPPVEGRANAALEALIAGAVGVPPWRVAVVSGASSRRKVVEVEGLTSAELLALLGPDSPSRPR